MDQILAEEAVNGGADETVQWTLTDHLNTVRDIAKYDSQTDTTTVVNHLVYDAFGRVTRMPSRRRKPAVDSLFLFTARPFDADTDLQNNLHRWYDPRVGRWLSEDPIGFNAGDENLYRYVGNEPLRCADPNGKELVTVTVISASVANITYHGFLTVCYAYWCAKCEGDAQKLIDRAARNFGGDVLGFQNWLKTAKPGSECSQVCAGAVKEGTYFFISLAGGVIVKYGVRYVE